jgi:DNA (cytosine-5)-methyltransferase 1
VTFGSLFSGVGGLDLGLERAGFECRWQVEKDEFCRKVLQKHWPGVPKYGDIYEVDFTTLEPVDLICGGFPCQPFSCAGKQLGENDERYLWPEFARAIRQVKPQWVLLENVPGLLAMAREFGQVLADLASCGFDASWSVLSACSMGAPHTRKRLFVVANANGARLERRWQHGKRAPKRPTWSGLEGADWNQLAAHFHGMVDGPSHRTHRIKAGGNAVNPDCAEWIGRRIMEH